MLPGGRGGEIIIVAAIALIVVGPKDLPKLLRQLGRFLGKMRAMADDFRMSFEDMARQSELDELRKEVEAMRTQNAPSVLGDVKGEIHALDSDLRTHMSLDHSRSAVMMSLPEPEATIPGPQTADSQMADPKIADPQMEGLPPKGAVPVTEPISESAAAPAPKPRKPRAPKVEAETAPPVVAEEAPIAKPARRKSTRSEKATS